MADHTILTQALRVIETEHDSVHYQKIKTIILENCENNADLTEPYKSIYDHLDEQTYFQQDTQVVYARIASDGLMLFAAAAKAGVSVSMHAGGHIDYWMSQAFQLTDLDKKDYRSETSYYAKESNKLAAKFTA